MATNLSAWPVADGDDARLSTTLADWQQVLPALGGTAVLLVVEHIEEARFLTSRLLASLTSTEITITSEDPWLSIDRDVIGRAERRTPAVLEARDPAVVVVLGGECVPDDLRRWLAAHLAAWAHVTGSVVVLVCERWSAAGFWTSAGWHVWDPGQFPQGGDARHAAIRTCVDAAADRLSGTECTGVPPTSEIVERLAVSAIPRGYWQVSDAIDAARRAAEGSRSWHGFADAAVAALRKLDRPAAPVTRSAVAASLYEVVRIIEELGKEVATHAGINPLAGLRLPDLGTLDGEPRDWFAGVVSRLYAWTFDGGAKLFRFLDGLAPLGSGVVYQPAGRASAVEMIEALRTMLSHATDPDSDRARAQDARRRSWFLRTCGTGSPRAQHWRALTLQLASEYARYLGGRLELVRRLEHDSDTCERLQAALTATLPKHVFHALAAETFAAIGFPGDVDKFVMARLAAWLTSVEKLDFHGEWKPAVRSLVEGDVVSWVAEYLPITGKDIMTRFGVKGPEVGELLAKAKLIRAGRPMISPEELLAELAAGREATKLDA